MPRTRTILLLATAAWLSLTAVTVAEQNRPNILWIVAEDLSLWMGCYGDKANQDHTPVIG